VIKPGRLKSAGNVAGVRERKGAYKILVEKPERRRPLGRTRHRWEDNIKVDLKQVVWGASRWMDLAEDTDSWRSLVNGVMNILAP
jgi:hypothetical protein